MKKYFLIVTLLLNGVFYSVTHGKNTSRNVTVYSLDGTSYDEIVIDIGMLRNYVSNSTKEFKTNRDRETFLIGRDDGKYPSMDWLEGGYENNSYLHFGKFIIGYNNNTIRFSTLTSDDFEVIRNQISQSSPFEVRFSMTDDLAEQENKVGVKCLCNVHAWPEDYRDDMFIYEYFIINMSGHTMSDIYTGLYMDYDVSAAGGYYESYGWFRDDGADYLTGLDKNGEPESISYMYDRNHPSIPGNDEGGRFSPKESLGYVGSRILETPITNHGIPANQQSGHWHIAAGNDPNNGSSTYRLISDEYFSPVEVVWRDLRVFQTMGPWDLESNDTLHIVIGIGIGEGLDGLRENLQTAYDLYWNDFEGPSAPYITSYIPTVDSISIYQPDPVTFQIDAFDKNGDLINYRWEINGAMLNTDSGEECRLLSSDYPIGFHTISVVAADDVFETKHEWTVEIKPPKKYALFPNFPNPFNSTTTIRFEIKQDGLVQIELYDILGRKVKTLLEENLPFGVHEIAWDGTDDNGTPLPGGCYFYKIRAGEFKAVEKMLLLK